MRWTLGDCCACNASGKAAALEIPAIKSRRLMNHLTRHEAVRITVSFRASTSETDALYRNKTDLREVWNGSFSHTQGHIRLSPRLPRCRSGASGSPPTLTLLP